MKHTFKPGFALASLTCALLGATLAGCNNGGGATTSGMTGAPAGALSDTLATVGGSKVTRADLNSFLEAQSGEQALPLLIDTQLVFEALKAKGLEVTPAEVDADLARRQAIDPRVETLVKEGGAQLPIIKTQIKRELAIQKLLAADVKATDAQVKSFFDKNRKYYDQAAKTSVAMLLSSTKTRATLMADQLKKKTKTVAELVAEQKKVADPIAGQSIEDASQSQIWSQLAPTVTPLTDKLPQGGVTPVQQLAPQVAGIFVVTKRTAPIKADFEKMRAEVEADYKSAEVAKQTIEIARKATAGNPQVPQNPATLEENVSRTFTALQQQNPGATLRDALNYINQTAANELISKLRTGGTVQISDPSYAKVAEPYASKTAPADATGNTATDNSATGNSATENTASENTATGNAAPAAP